MFDPVQNALIARKLGDAPLGLYGSRGYLARRGRPATLEDLFDHDVIGFDRSDLIIHAYAAHGFAVIRDHFPVRCDDPIAYWHLLLSGAGLGIGQTLVARRHADLEAVDVGLRLPALPVWLVMHEEVRTSARIRTVADYLTTELGKALH